MSEDNSDVPFLLLSAQEQWDLVKQMHEALAWNRMVPAMPLERIPTVGGRQHKSAGEPSYVLERKRGYVT